MRHLDDRADAVTLLAKHHRVQANSTSDEALDLFPHLSLSR
jgi:hypothetical protein